MATIFGLNTARFISLSSHLRKSYGTAFRRQFVIRPGGAIPISKPMSPKLWIIYFSIAGVKLIYQVDLSPQKSLCLDIDIPHEDVLLLLLHEDLCQVTNQY